MDNSRNLAPSSPRTVNELLPNRVKIRGVPIREAFATIPYHMQKTPGRHKQQPDASHGSVMPRCGCWWEQP